MFEPRQNETNVSIYGTEMTGHGMKSESNNWIGIMISIERVASGSSILCGPSAMREVCMLFPRSIGILTWRRSNGIYSQRYMKWY